MKIPTSRADGSMRQLVRINAQEYTVTRPTEGAGRFGDPGDTSATSTATHTEDLFLFSPNDAVIQTEFGERENADLFGLALSGVDLQERDRITEDGVDFEVTSTEYHPSGHDKQFLAFDLVKRVN